ncbi:MAG: tetratricopeptide repeat protein [Planctomycetota bacterium]
MSARISLLLFAVALALGACGSGDAPDTLYGKWNAGLLDTERAFALLRGGNEEAAHEAFASARARALTVIRGLESGAFAAEPDAHRLPDRMGAMIRLAELSMWLGMNDPVEFRRGARLASRAVDEASTRPEAWGVLGAIFLHAGLWDRAADCFERHLELANPEKRTRVYDDLILCRLRLSERELASGGLRSPGIARRHLTRAHELATGGEPRPDLSTALERLNLQYAGEANPAVERGDDLELARIHSRYGHLDLCKQKLDEVVSKRGVVGEVRWVVARYWYEPGGTREMLEKADQVYTDLLKDGTGDSGGRERALAGRIRVRRRLGRTAAVLELHADAKDPGPEVREELARAWLDRAARRDAKDFDGWRADLLRIEGLLAGDLPDALRADLFVETGFQSVRFGDRDHLERLVAQFRRTWPEDRRVLLLEAGVDGLRQEPLLPDELGEGGNEPGETR